MNLQPLKSMLQRHLQPWRPESSREAGSGIVSNFLLHWFPNRVSLKSYEFSYSWYLGTISFVLFLILGMRPPVPRWHEHA